MDHDDRIVFNYDLVYPLSCKLAPLPTDLAHFYIDEEFPLPPRCNSDACRHLKGPTIWFVCLICGKNCCPADNCPQSYRTHMKQPCPYDGMFLVPNECAVYLISSTGAYKRIPAPYLDSHGATDLGFR